MKNQKRGMRFTVVAAGLLTVFAIFGARGAEALTTSSAGTTLTNSVTVDYKDNIGVAQTRQTSSVSVTVNLVGSVAWLTAPTGQDASSGTALPAAYTIKLHNLGNGSDTFTIGDHTLTPGTFTSSGTFPVTIASATLFGTVSLGGATSSIGVTSIPVSNLTVPDAVVGKIVRIGNTDYPIAANSTTTSLKVTGDATTDAAVGVQIGEVYTVTVNGTVGTLSANTATADQTHSLSATGTSQMGNTAATASSSTWTTHVFGPVVTVQKYVRNTVTARNPSSGGTSLYGQTYWTSNVTGNPGDTLEYLVVITNSSTNNKGIATNVIFEDTFPSYTAYSAGSVKVDTTGAGTFDHLIGTDTESCSGASGSIIVTDTCGGASPTKLKVFAGTGGAEGATYPAGTGGSIIGGVTSAVWYQVTIN